MQFLAFQPGSSGHCMQQCYWVLRIAAGIHATLHTTDSCWHVPAVQLPLPLQQEQATYQGIWCLCGIIFLAVAQQFLLQCGSMAVSRWG